MANTGRVIVLTLQEEEVPGYIPTGNTKVNEVSDEDYIPPYIDTEACPVTYTTDCPDLIATGLDDSVVFEFALQNDVVLNPAIAYVKVKAMLVGVEQGNVTFTLPITAVNYFNDVITGLADSATYDIDVDYLDSSLSVVQNCPALASVTTT